MSEQLITFPRPIDNTALPSPGRGLALTDQAKVPSTAFPVYVSYTPTLHGTTSNPNLGSTGTIVGSYVQFGQFVHGHVIAKFGGSGVAVGSGNYVISIPVAFNDFLSVNAALGAWFAVHSGSNFGGPAAFGSGAIVMPISGSGFLQSGTAAWAAGDVISVDFMYRSA